MRLRDVIGGRDDAPLDDSVQAELDALDAALAGDDVPAGMEGLQTLVSDLRAERPEPDPAFGPRLDEWAASGFERGRRPRFRPEGSAPRSSWLGSTPPRRILAPAGAAVTLIVVVAVGISQVDTGRDETQSLGGGGVAEAPEAVAPAVPEDAPVAGGGDVEAFNSPAKAEPAVREALSDRDRALSAPEVADNASTQGTAAPAEERKVERSAQLTLTAPEDEVQDVTNDAIGVVQGFQGFVLSSRVSQNDGSADAYLELMIPTRNLDAALDELSGLADVRNFSEGSLDITRPYVDARDRVQDLRAERRNLLTRIEQADTQAEVDQLKLQLAGVTRQLSQARAEFENLGHRARRAMVTLQITSQGAEESGDWSFEDALDDAGHVLTVAAGIALISAAVLLPLALIAAIAYALIRTANRRAREKALDT